jgi:hypothetical protein
MIANGAENLRLELARLMLRRESFGRENERVFHPRPEDLALV